MDDSTLKQTVEDELAWEPSVDAAAISVAVKDGIVHLTGHVGRYAEKVSTENVVKRLRGVRGFVDDLVVRPFAETYSDQAIAEHVANVMDWDAVVPKGAVKARVEDGWVTLSGETRWNYQRFAAEQSVKRLHGVRGVTNSIVVTPDVHPIDVKKRIEEALERQAVIDADRVRITVDGDRVRLDGKVRAWFEREAIEKAVWAAPGVKLVDDRVTVGS